jgi:hypothetical protein
MPLAVQRVQSFDAVATRSTSCRERRSRHARARPPARQDLDRCRRRHHDLCIPPSRASSTRMTYPPSPAPPPIPAAIKSRPCTSRRCRSRCKSYLARLGATSPRSILRTIRNSPRTRARACSRVASGGERIGLDQERHRQEVARSPVLPHRPSGNQVGAACATAEPAATAR